MYTSKSKSFSKNHKRTDSKMTMISPERDMKLSVKNAHEERQRISNRIMFLQNEQAKYMKKIE